MITVDALRAWGADVDAGLARCMNSEPFYIRLVGMELGDKNFEGLRAAVEAGDTRAAFEAAHALKGATGNLGLEPIYAPVSELTELLRGADGAVDTGDLVARITGAFESLKALAE